MNEYFVIKNAANMMTKPDPDSALDSQALSGTIVIVEKTENDYCYVQTPDLYHGWIAKRRLTPVWDRSAYETVIVKTLFADVHAKAEENSPLLTKLVIGSRLPLASKHADSVSSGSHTFVEILLPDKQAGFIFANCLEPWQNSEANEIAFEEKWRSSNSSEREKIIAYLGKRTVTLAKRFMGVPYLWGGGTPFGIDCSGLTQLAYKLNGVQLLRNSYMQNDDHRFNKIEKDKALENADLQAGDLVFFDIKQSGKIDHVGIACGDGSFIQARGEMLDGGMVINECKDSYYNKIYMGAVRLSANAEINISAADTSNIPANT